MSLNIAGQANTYCSIVSTRHILGLPHISQKCRVVFNSTFRRLLRQNKNILITLLKIKKKRSTK